MATGGERNAVWRFTATSAPNQTGSNFSASTTGEKIGRKTGGIAGHSKGQPRRKMSSITRSSVANGGTGSASIVFVITVAVPRRANTAPKTLEVTARKRT